MGSHSLPVTWPSSAWAGPGGEGWGGPSASRADPRETGSKRSPPPRHSWPFPLEGAAGSEERGLGGRRERGGGDGVYQIAGGCPLGSSWRE